MTKQEPPDHSPNQAAHHPYRVHLPGFVRDDDVGLGDLVMRATSTLGIRPCGSCERRAATLNGWLAFSSRKSRS